MAVDEHAEALDYQKEEQKRSLQAMDANRDAAISGNAASVELTKSRAHLRTTFAGSISALTVLVIAGGIWAMVHFFG